MSKRIKKVESIEESTAVEKNNVFINKNKKIGWMFSPAISRFIYFIYTYMPLDSVDRRSSKKFSEGGFS